MLCHALLILLSAPACHEQSSPSLRCDIHCSDALLEPRKVGIKHFEHLFFQPTEGADDVILIEIIENSKVDMIGIIAVEIIAGSEAGTTDLEDYRISICAIDTALFPSYGAEGDEPSRVGDACS